jgi:hypothetical protein
MAISELYSGSATVGTTEFSLVSGSTTLASDTTDGVFQVMIDTNNITSGDQFEFFVKEKVTSSGSQRVIYQSYMTGAMAETYVYPTLILMHGWDVTIRKLSGTDRSISWSIRQVA